MKNRNQARLVREARQAMGFTQEQMARQLGLKERPGAQFVSNIEHGKCRMAAFRWRILRKLVPKEVAREAYLVDAMEQWEQEYHAD